ncbi:hypothetical protein ACC754_42765, partial [Rhizobium johnstonii]
VPPPDPDPVPSPAPGLAPAPDLDHDLNQVSFGIMMVKGFAKTDADGRSRWDISVSRDGAIAVNGQVVKGPDGQDQDQDQG